MTAAANDLVVERLSAGYPRRSVISELTLDPFRAGEITALVGPNAAGKSTLMLALAGLIKATGSVLLGNRQLLAMPQETRAKLVTFMPQALPQGIALNVLESVMAALKASPARDDQAGRHMIERAYATLERLAIADLALEQLGRLSGGQRQLVSLAQAVVRQPEVLLLDEPTSALDLRHQASVMGFASELAAEGRVVVVVLHDLNLATRWANRIVVLRDGAAAAQGTPDDAVTAEVLAHVYEVDADVERSARGHLRVSVNGVLQQGGVEGSNFQKGETLHAESDELIRH